MVERKGDKTNHCGRLLLQRERIALKAFLHRLNPYESARTLGSMIYSRHNHRSDGTRLLASPRLPLPLLPTYCRSQLDCPPLAQYVIQGDCSLSDYCPVEVTLQLVDRGERRIRCGMHISWVEDVTIDLHRLWNQQPSTSSCFLATDRATLRFYEEFCSRRAAQRRTKEITLRQLSEAAAAFQVQPHDPQTQENHGQAMDHLKRLETLEIAGHRVRSRIR